MASRFYRVDVYLAETRSRNSNSDWSIIPYLPASAATLFPDVDKYPIALAIADYSELVEGLLGPGVPDVYLLLEGIGVVEGVIELEQYCSDRWSLHSGKEIAALRENRV